LINIDSEINIQEHRFRKKYSGTSIQKEIFRNIDSEKKNVTINSFSLSATDGNRVHDTGIEYELLSIERSKIDQNQCKQYQLINNLN